MLDFFRKNLKIFIWMIVLSFVIWGGSSFTSLREETSAYAGKVWGERISYKEFMTTGRFYELLFQAHRPDETAPGVEPPSPEELHGLTWQMIILSREAKRMGLQVSDQEVAQEIQRQFSTLEGFNVNFYQRWVRDSFRGRPRDFEEVVRKYLAGQKVREKVLAPIAEDKREAQWLGWISSLMTTARFEDYTTR